jgi:hypothetical protein
MNPIPHRVLAPLPLPPVPNIPPVLGDVTEIKAYKKLLKKRKAADINSVTDDEIATVYVAEMQVALLILI